METLCDWTGRNADSLPPPDGLDRNALRRALDLERLAEEVPDIPRVRLRKIASLRDEIRRGVYETPERLGIAIRRALGEAARPRRRT